MFSDRRGVSETVSFVLVFAMMVSTVGVVYAVGYGGLVDARDNERVDNAERAMDVLATNVEDMTRRGAPSRGTEIQLADATLGSGQATVINVSLSDPSLENVTTGNLSADPIVYSSGDTDLRYALGAVVRVQPGGSVMIDEPSFVIGQDHTIVPVVETSFDDGSVGGSTTVLVRTSRQLRETRLSRTDTYDTLTINVTTPGGDAWRRYLEEAGTSCSETDLADGRTKLTCTLSDVERTHVPWYFVEVSFA